MRTIPKQKFTQEFRKEAVRLVMEQGLSTVEDVAAMAAMLEKHLKQAFWAA